MSVPYFSEGQVRELVTLADVIDTLEEVIGRGARGSAGLAPAGDAAIDIPKSLGTWEPSSSAHTLGGVDLGLQVAVFKNWVNTPNGATALLSLFDTSTGQLLAVMEAVYLGSLRTAAIAGVATRRMAPREAKKFAIIGSGRQALKQVQAVAAVAPLEDIRVWSPTEANRSHFAEQVAANVDVEVSVAPTLEAV